ncbi:M23 family metallopeptidase [Mariniluteicoccus flavus]
MKRVGVIAAVAVGLAALPAGAYAAPTPTPTPSASATPTPTPTPVRLAVAPIAEGSYTLGARWGQMGPEPHRFHAGQDFVAPIGTPVLAVRDGVVIASQAGAWAGNNVMIDHGAAGTTLSTFLRDVTVQPGQRVRRGDVIGHVGVTGKTFGPHLHFEFYPRGADLANPRTTTDPIPFLQTQGSPSTPKPAPTDVRDKDSSGGLAKTGS